MTFWSWKCVCLALLLFIIIIIIDGRLLPRFDEHNDNKETLTYIWKIFILCSYISYVFTLAWSYERNGWRNKTPIFVYTIWTCK